ncbi:hypothetical protein [Chryseolinea lacunae]|uniref:Uncharacterized protein n=1 Tax=Chryseolinea lacunae TaxID=2801331 RepID=A0ABS1L0X7_9BACT|nr:hypothetical protein [Chryseolinea lacunae]MBL0745108.1 hypothetical protein [Chryseolinea lacunae]
MMEFLKFVALMGGTYLCSVGFAIVLFKLFFPLKAKEEVQKIKVARSAQPRPKRQRREVLSLAGHGH